MVICSAFVCSMLALMAILSIFGGSAQEDSEDVAVDTTTEKGTRDKSDVKKVGNLEFPYDTTSKQLKYMTLSMPHTNYPVIIS